MGAMAQALKGVWKAEATSQIPEEAVLRVCCSPHTLTQAVVSQIEQEKHHFRAYFAAAVCGGVSPSLGRCLEGGGHQLDTTHDGHWPVSTPCQDTSGLCLDTC